MVHMVKDPYDSAFNNRAGGLLRWLLLGCWDEGVEGYDVAVTWGKDIITL